MTPQNHVQPDSHRGLHWAALIARALATSVEVFLHDTRTFGERYLGPPAVIAAGLLVLFAGMWGDEDPGPVLVYLCLYLLLCGAVRSGAVARRRRGEPAEHSYYSGRPRFGRLGDRIGETSVKGVLEPVLVLLVGALVAEASPPLGTYLMFAAGGLFFSVQSGLAAERRRALDMHDAQLDQRRLADQWRRLRGD